jgi:peptidyl-dipeptidase A
MLGELFASQLHHYYVHNILKLKSDKLVSYANDKKLGRFLRNKVFGPGAKYRWSEMIERATGEPLNTKYFAEQFVK